jgi:hypothetical protein
MTLIQGDNFEKENERKKLKKMMENKNSKKYTITIPENIHMRFKEKILYKRKTMKSVILSMILNYIEKK